MDGEASAVVPVHKLKSRLRAGILRCAQNDKRGAAFVIVVLAAYWMTRGRPTIHIEHLITAWCWLQGRPWIDGFQRGQGVVWESVKIGGHWFGVHPPLSALVCLPFVWLAVYDQTFVEIIVGAAAAGALWWMMGRMGCERRGKAWLAAFFSFGTIVWYEATLGASWGFCAVLSTIPTSIASGCVLWDKDRELSVHCEGSSWSERCRRSRSATAVFFCGLCAGLAALARYDLVLVWPVYAGLLIASRRSFDTPRGARRLRMTDVGLYVGGLLPALIAAVLYAEARFGKPYDIAFFEWWKFDAPRLGLDVRSGPFGLRYLWQGIYVAVFMAPRALGRWPFYMPQIAGQSILATSPAFLLALRAPWRRGGDFWNCAEGMPVWDWQVPLLWAAVVLGMGAAMLTYAAGAVQFGARYWIQVYPFLLALMVKGWTGDGLDKALIVVSIVLIAWGMYAIREYGGAQWV